VPLPATAQKRVKNAGGNAAYETSDNNVTSPLPDPTALLAVVGLEEPVIGCTTLPIWHPLRPWWNHSQERGRASFPSSRRGTPGKPCTSRVTMPAVAERLLGVRPRPALCFLNVGGAGRVVTDL